MIDFRNIFAFWEFFSTYSYIKMLWVLIVLTQFLNTRNQASAHAHTSHISFMHMVIARRIFDNLSLRRAFITGS